MILRAPPKFLNSTVIVVLTSRCLRNGSCRTLRPRHYPHTRSPRFQYLSAISLRCLHPATLGTLKLVRLKRDRPLLPNKTVLVNRDRLLFIKKIVLVRIHLELCINKTVLVKCDRPLPINKTVQICNQLEQCVGQTVLLNAIAAAISVFLTRRRDSLLS